jgi:hypothetical protein
MPYLRHSRPFGQADTQSKAFYAPLIKELILLLVAHGLDFFHPTAFNARF